MSISLKKAVEICCREGSCKIVSGEFFLQHLESYGVHLTAEVYTIRCGGELENNYIFYRDIRDNDVVGLNIFNDLVSTYRTVSLKELE